MDQIKDRPHSDRALIKLLIPIIIERLLAVTVGLADSLMVASVGEAAVSLVDSVNVLFIDLCSFRAIGPVVTTVICVLQRCPWYRQCGASGPDPGEFGSPWVWTGLCGSCASCCRSGKRKTKAIKQ